MSSSTKKTIRIFRKREFKSIKKAVRLSSMMLFLAIIFLLAMKIHIKYLIPILNSSWINHILVNIFLQTIIPFIEAEISIIFIKKNLSRLSIYFYWQYLPKHMMCLPFLIHMKYIFILRFSFFKYLTITMFPFSKQYDL